MNADLALKDILVILIPSVASLIAIITAWVRLKTRIDRNDEIHKEISKTLIDLTVTSKERHDFVKDKLSLIRADVGQIKTSIAVIKERADNLKEIVERLENVG